MPASGGRYTEIQDGVQAPHPEMPTWLPPAFTAPCRKPQTDALLIGNRHAVRETPEIWPDLRSGQPAGHEGRITRVSAARQVAKLVRIDLNADVGESFGAYRYGDDEGVMPFVTSANVACGFHAGDPGVMREHGRAGPAARRRGRRPPGLPRSGGIWPPRDAPQPGRGGEPRRLPDRRAGRHRRGRGGPAQPREAARRALQHGRPRCGAWPTPSRAASARWTHRWCCSGCRGRSSSTPASGAGLRVASEVFRRPRLSRRRQSHAARARRAPWSTSPERGGCRAVAMVGRLQ